MIKPIYLLDTNIVSEYMKPIPNKKILNKLGKLESRCVISSTTWYELLFGFEILPSGKRKDGFGEILIDEIQQKFQILPYDNHCAWIQADIRSRLKEIGTSVEFQDTQIASIAISNQLVLVTQNTKHFEPIKEISSAFFMEDWSI